MRHVTCEWALVAWFRRGGTRFQITHLLCLKEFWFPPTIGYAGNAGSRLPTQKIKIWTTFANFVIIQLNICQKTWTHDLPTRRVMRHVTCEWGMSHVNEACGIYLYVFSKIRSTQNTYWHLLRESRQHWIRSTVLVFIFVFILIFAFIFVCSFLFSFVFSFVQY